MNLLSEKEKEKRIEISALAFKRSQFFEFRKDARTFIDKKITNLHYDVMDGEFVKNKSFPNLEHLDWLIKLKFRVSIHLMVKHVQNYMTKLIAKSSNIGSITFHCEPLNVDESIEIIKNLRNKNLLVGIAIAPNTKLNPYLELIKMSSIITVMSVQPGYGGQAFIEGSQERVKEIRKLAHKNTIIELDGGLNMERISQTKHYADWFVSGTYLYKNIYKYNELLKIVNSSDQLNSVSEKEED